jgi:chemotaxis protein MotB
MQKAVRAGLALAAASWLAACVTRGTHERVVAERDDLASRNRELTERVRLLESSNESLSGERLKLIDQIEDLHQESDRLDREVAELRNAHEELSGKAEKLQELQGTYAGLVGDLEAEVAAGQIQIEQLREGIRLNLSEEILFGSGSATVGPDGERVLGRVAAQLHKAPYRVEVQGHTDDVPIAGALAARYPTNWELAGARAARVVRILEADGVDPGSLSAISFGPFHPVADNDTPEGRARNRRIEIRLIPVPTSELVPSPAAAPASVSTPAP